VLNNFETAITFKSLDRFYRNLAANMEPTRLFPEMFKFTNFQATIQASGFTGGLNATPEHEGLKKLRAATAGPENDGLFNPALSGPAFSA
jgi:hypothetical protein